MLVSHKFRWEDSSEITATASGPGAENKQFVEALESRPRREKAIISIVEEVD